MSWLDGDQYSSERVFRFSKQIKILKVTGPRRRYLLRYQGWMVRVFVWDEELNIPDTYMQSYESWPHAFIRSMYYRVYKFIHNVRYHL